MNSSELINYTKDIDYEYNIKFILLLLFSAYSLFALWYWNKTEVEYLAQYYVKMVTTILAKSWFTLLPLWVFFLVRTAPYDVILQPLLVLYGVAMIMFMIYLFVFGTEKIKSFFTGEGFYRFRK